MENTMAQVVHLASDLAPDFYNDFTTVGTTAVRVTPNNHPVLKGIQIKASATNTDTIYIGKSNVTTTNGFPLAAGEGLFIPVEKISEAFAISGTGGQDLRWLAV